MPLTGNKGEWSEVYVLFRLLADGKLYAADNNMQRNENIYFPILKIIRKEGTQKDCEYRLENSAPSEVLFYLNNKFQASILKERFSEEAEGLLHAIFAGTCSFSVPAAERFLHSIGCSRLAASSSDKTDITLQLHDIRTGYSPLCGFSIKSELGNPPTLINASKATNFIYQVENLTPKDIQDINACSSRTKIQDRMNLIRERGGRINFSHSYNSTFSRNLLMIDTQFENILAEAIKIHYFDGLLCCSDIVERLQETDPLQLGNQDVYAYKFKQFLYAAALGMTPSTHWNGFEDANGGYIIVTDRGDILTFYIYNKTYFENYLLNTTRFERASTTKHEYASIYTENNRNYLNLNLQIRFLK